LPEVGGWDWLEAVTAVWVHNFDPVILRIGESPLALRWYGLSYLAAFVAGYLLLRWLAKKDLWVMAPEKAGDFIAYGAIFGVFVGGRLGYVLFYMIPERGMEAVTRDPLVVFKVWEGGMASHGGILGLLIFTWFYARREKVSWLRLGDGLCVVAPLGLFFGRLANFINGELYGRTASEVAWAMKFPRALLEAGDRRFVGAMAEAVRADADRPGSPLPAAWEAYQEALAGPVAERVDRLPLFERVMDAGRRNPEVMEALGKYLEARHPSQLYQAFLEGLLLFVVLLATRLRFSALAPGVLTGMFFLMYALFRIVAERFRAPDAAWVVEGILTKGQFYSLFMIAIGAAFLVGARVATHRTAGRG